MLYDKCIYFKQNVFLLYSQKSKSGKVAFVKVHVPWKVLAKGAEIMNMKMPIAVSHDLKSWSLFLFFWDSRPSDIDSFIQYFLHY